MKIAITSFALRHWQPDASGTRIEQMSSDDLVALCQGAGNAWSGLGVLIDEAGADDYRCSQRCWGFGSQEKQTAPFGFFLDLAGVEQ